MSHPTSSPPSWPCRRWRNAGAVVMCIVALGLVALGLAPRALADDSAAAPPIALTEDERIWLRTHPSLRLGVDPAYAPYSYIDARGHFEGAAAEIVRLVGERLGITFEVVALQGWSDVLSAARAREIDVIATVAPAPDREDYLRLTAPYLATPLVITTRDDEHAIRGAADLRHRTVALVAGYASSEHVLASQPDIQVLAVQSPLEALIAVATGRADAHVGAIGVNLAIARRNGIANLRVAAPYDLDNAQALGVRSDQPVLAGLLDKGLKSIPAETLERIHARWVPTDPPSADTRRGLLTTAERAWLDRHSRIRIGIAENDEPIEFVDGNAGMAGLVPAHVELIRAKVPIRIEYVRLANRAALLAALDAGHVDMVSVQVARANARPLLLTASIHNSLLAVFAPYERGSIGDLSDLQGHPLALKEAGPADRVLRRHPDIVPLSMSSARDALSAAAGGSAAAALTELVSGTYLIERYGLRNLRTAAVLTGDEAELRFAVRTDWPILRGIVDKALAAATPEELAAIRRNTIGGMADSGIPHETVVFWAQVALAIVLSAFLAFAYAANRRLKAEVTRRRHASDAARQSEQRFRATFEQAAVGIAMVAPDGRWLRANRRLREMLGYDEARLGETGFQHLTHPDDLDADRVAVERLLAGETASYSLDKRYVCADGSLVWAKNTVALVRDDEGRPNYFISVIEDITRRKQDEAQIQFLAYYDPLTRLPNRALLGDHAALALADAKRREGGLALLFVDLDDFKSVNDTLGHGIGDQLLVEVAARIKACVRAGDTIGRQGGDEFLLLLADVPAHDPAQAIAATVDKICAQLQAPFHIDSHELSVSASIGIASYPGDGADFETLLRKADTAMYSAKAAGRNTYRFFTEQMNLNAVEYEQLRSGLRTALDRGQFRLVYQPQFDIATRRLVGAEALLRWTHPMLGPVSPGRFVPIAEDSGLIVAIGAWVLDEACRQAVAWRNAGLDDISIAVNLSAAQFVRGNLVETVADTLARSGLDARRLELELTESTLLEHADDVLDTMRRLRRLGVRLAIDDFGTGYSSLSYLKHLPVDKLKIDQSFVRDMLDSPDDAAIVQSIIALADNLRIATLAEGIETEAQFAALRDAGCSQCQGYLLGRPMLPAEFGAIGASAIGPAG